MLRFAFSAQQRWFQRDLAINLLGFLPLGLIVAWQRGRSGVLLGLGAGLALSLVVELGQVFIPGRSSSAIDLVANTLGAGLGAGLALPSRIPESSFTSGFLRSYCNFLGVEAEMMIAELQKAITDTVNYWILNMLLANTRIVKSRLNTIPGGTLRIWPWKNVEVANPEDLSFEAMADVYNSGPVAVQIDSAARLMWRPQTKRASLMPSASVAIACYVAPPSLGSSR